MGDASVFAMSGKILHPTLADEMLSLSKCKLIIQGVNRDLIILQGQKCVWAEEGSQQCKAEQAQKPHLCERRDIWSCN